jgi:hypothetical protein
MIHGGKDDHVTDPRFNLQKPEVIQLPLTSVLAQGRDFDFV